MLMLLTLERCIIRLNTNSGHLSHATFYEISVFPKTQIELMN